MTETTTTDELDADRDELEDDELEAGDAATPGELEDGRADDAATNRTDEPDTTEQKLRRQAQRYRLRARDATSAAERYARELFTARLAALDVLADPSDMPFDAALLDEPDALAGAVAELIERKPHLAKRLAAGDIGQGRGTGSRPGDVSLVSLISGTGHAR